MTRARRAITKPDVISRVFAVDEQVRIPFVINMPEETLKRYGKRLGPKLKEVMEHFFKTGDHIDVREELALARTVHMQNQGLLDCAMELEFPATPEGVQLQREAIQIAGSIAMQSAERIIAMCEKVAKIDALAGQKNSPYALDSIKAQMCQFIYRIFDAPESWKDGTPEQQAEFTKRRAEMLKFETAMDNELELPTLLSRGTTITPDMQVQAMDATIPFCE